MLSPSDKKTLLQIARETIASIVQSRKRPAFDVTSPALTANGAAFVTLNKRGQLRGCIGHVDATGPLWSTVRDMATAAATQDPRFHPVTKDEVAQLHIEISVMTPMKKVSSPEEIVVGKHGLMMVRSFRSGLLLPQVATEYGWTREEFLQHTCLKAGMSPDAWKDPATEIYCFSAEVFGEEESGPGRS
ncbi:MAG: AmmeMemoRadiSam system protein A [Planctomycetota bacterium]|nr:AmmeMemoRadiSam system protein A [Planctomycetota bacterium]